jgi:hypothetical protein
MVENVGRGSRWNYAPLLETEVYTDQQSSIFLGSVPLGFQVAPGIGKIYIHAENAKTTEIGPLRNRTFCLA